MPTVVADAGPLHYLVLIETEAVLPRLFGRVLIPEMVAAELNRPATPARVRQWLVQNPNWLERQPGSPTQGSPSRTRDAGERAAIELAQTVGATLLLIDDRAGDDAAQARGLKTIGTLGILVQAAQLGLVELEGAFAKLRKTNFRYRPELLDALLAQHEAKKP